MPFLSVIVPVYGATELLESCLASIRRSQFTDYELIVADDGSPEPEPIRKVCERHGAVVVRLGTNRGPAVARNAAARKASGEVLTFLDSDVTPHPDALLRTADVLRTRPEVAAVIGSYDFQPGVQGQVAVFRNLLHAHVHHRSAGEVNTFWAGCGSVRRGLFLDAGGFSESYDKPSIEDVEFGLRLHAAAGRIVLDPSIQVTHHKRWTLWSMFYTDMYHRARPWTALIRKGGLPRQLNFRWNDRASLLASVLIPVFAVLGLFESPFWWMVPACLAAIVLLQRELFGFLARERGVAFATMSLPIYVVHHLAAAAGLLLGLAGR